METISLFPKTSFIKNNFSTKSSHNAIKNKINDELTRVDNIMCKIQTELRINLQNSYFIRLYCTNKDYKELLDAYTKFERKYALFRISLEIRKYFDVPIVCMFSIFDDSFEQHLIEKYIEKINAYETECYKLCETLSVFMPSLKNIC